MIRALPLLAILTLCGNLAATPAAAYPLALPAPQTVADQTLAPVPGGVAIWPSYNGNRRQYTGAIFYLQHLAGAPLKVTLRYRSVGTAGQLRDGQPENLVLRLFGPADRTLAAATLGQLDKQVYQLTLDLGAQPAGRYRLALTGWHDGLALAAEPAQPIGILGGGTLGVQSPGDYYLLVPPDTATWTVSAATTKPDIALALLDTAGKTLAIGNLPRSPNFLSPNWLKLTRPAPGDAAAQPQVVHLQFAGEAPVMLAFDGLPGVLWPSADAAAKPTFSYRHGRRLAFAWQQPLADYLASLTAADLAMPALKLPPLPYAELTDTQIQQLAQVAGWDNGPATAISLLYDNQIADPARPDCGLFADSPANAPPLPLNPDADNSFGQLHYLHGLTGLLAAPIAGFNPWQNHPVLARRVAAAFCQILLQIPARQTVNQDFVHRKYLGLAARNAWPHLPPELREPLAAGLLEEFSRDAYFDGYQSNQGLNVQVGTYCVAELTRDPVLMAWHQRFLTAYFNDAFADDNHGQTAAGFYQEQAGLDGGYNSYSAQLLITLYRLTGDPRIRTSLERNFEFLRHLTVTMPGGAFVSARAWDTRLDGNAFRWHNHRAGCDLPSCATLWLGGRPDTPAELRARTIASLKKSWGKPVRPALSAKGKYWSDGGLEAEDAVPCAELLPLPCTLPGPLTRAFGDRYCIVQRGPWYAVFFTGDEWCHGAAGSGLATLWHRDFGPLLLGDTKQKLDEVPAYPLVVADLWQDASTEYCHGTFAVAGDTVTVDLKPLKGAWTFARAWTLGADGLTSTIAPRPGHRLVLPLVNGPALTLVPLDAKGQTIALAPDATQSLSGWRWQLGERTLTLRYSQPASTRILKPSEPCRPATLAIVELTLPAQAPFTLSIAP